jgi:hypothetical protein
LVQYFDGPDNLVLNLCLQYDRSCLFVLWKRVLPQRMVDVDV